MVSIRVLLIDSQALFRETLGARLASQSEFTIVGGAGDAATAADIAAHLHPEVIVTDLRLPDCFGAEIVVRLLSVQADARIVALTDVIDEETVAATVAAGALGYLLKCRQVDDLVEAVRAVANGGAALDPAVAPIIWRRFQKLARNDHSGEFGKLTPCEQEVLVLLVAGKSSRQMAKALACTPAVIERYVAGICQKLHARNRTQAAVIALSRGLVKAQ